MNNYLSILKAALKDPVLENIDCLFCGESSGLIGVIDSLPSDACISEWRYGLGEVKYEYHVHTYDISSKLREAFEMGFRAGHPKLTAIYSKDKFKSIIKSEVGSEHN
jgi:hypothetical protein